MPFVLVLLIRGMVVFGLSAAIGVAAADDQLDYSRDIRPILSDACFRCHGPDDAKREAGLRLDTFDGAAAETSGGHGVVPGDADSSEIIDRILSDDPDLKMPPPETGKTVTAEQVELLKRWIRQGAKYSQHWSFRPVVRPAVPNNHSSWGQNPIDQFIWKRMTARSLNPSPEAQRHTLIRRVYLDATGLPPTVEEVDQFLADASVDAYAQMVDRALSSPHYGERWGRHWLDQARYADTHGYTVDGERSIWPFRDWVIRALNDDMPFDQFTSEQLAGDLLPSPAQSQLVATGFHRNTLVSQEGGSDAEQFRNEAVVDRVNTTGAVWLGLTVGCAQCHTHKYDPITHHEYYQLFDFFNQNRDVNSVSPTLRLATAEQDQQLRQLDLALADIKKQLASLDKTVADQASTDEFRQTAEKEKSAVTERQKSLESDRKKLLAAIPETMVMADVNQPRVTHVHLRGDFLRHGDAVMADTPAFLPGMSTSGARRNRLDLAMWLVDRSNPLTARVTLNRIWARYFGQGLVETENDFGFQGTPPTHPELLDWLAAEFMDQGWSIKHMHRLILNSATYRQSSATRQDIQSIDPLNKLLARQVRQRVDAEIVRDIGLAVSGLLNPTIGGKSVYPPQPDGVYAFTQRNAGWPTSKGPDRYRRGMYTFFMRSAPYPMLTTFDTPRFDTTCTTRVRSNTPLQSLTMANDQAMLEIATALGQRIQRHSDVDADRLQFAFRLCFARDPLAQERQRLLDYIQQQRMMASRQTDTTAASDAQDSATQQEQQTEDRVWMLVGRTLMNLDEFIVRE